MPIVEMGGGQAVNVIGHPDGIGAVPAKGSKWQWSRGTNDMVVAILGATFRAGLLVAAVQRKLVFRHITFVEVGRISKSSTATVRQTVMPPGVRAAGAASHDGDEKMRLVFVR